MLSQIHCIPSLESRLLATTIRSSTGCCRLQPCTDAACDPSRTTIAPRKKIVTGSGSLLPILSTALRKRNPVFESEVVMTATGIRGRTGKKNNSPTIFSRRRSAGPARPPWDEAARDEPDTERTTRRAHNRLQTLAITCWREDPSPSIPSSTTSPALRKTGGLKPSPTPAGVPVLITSPGNNDIN